VNVRGKIGELQYGVFPEICAMRKVKANREENKLTKLDFDLMRNYDYLEDMMSKVDSQATLLQLAGYYDDALQIYDQRVINIRNSANEEEDSMNRCLIRKGDALRISGDYTSAEKEYQATSTKSEKFKLISKIHLAELYILRGQEDKFESIIDEITPNLNILEKDEKEEYLKGRNFVVIRTIKKGGFKKAEKMLEDLQK
jgi:tetratricopeptide (TPR) repeat protein